MLLAMSERSEVECESKRLYKPDTESVGSRGSRNRNGRSYSNTNTDYLKERV